MTQLDKLEAKIRNNPVNIRSSDIIKILTRYGFYQAVKNKRGSHHTILTHSIYKDTSKFIMLPIPSGKGEKVLRERKVKELLGYIDEVVEAQNEKYNW